MGAPRRGMGEADTFSAVNARVAGVSRLGPQMAPGPGAKGKPSPGYLSPDALAASIAARAARYCGSISFADETHIPRLRMIPSLMP
jgi:hypothetical protein